MQIVRLVFDFGSASRFGLRCGFGGDSFFAAPRQLGFSFGFSAFFCCHEIAGFAPEDLPWFEFLRIRAYDGIHWVWLHCWELPSLRKVSPASCVMMMSNVDIAQWFVWDSCNWGGPLSLHCAFRVNFCFVKKCLIISSIGGSADWIMDISADHGVLAALFGCGSRNVLAGCYQHHAWWLKIFLVNISMSSVKVLWYQSAPLRFQEHTSCFYEILQFESEELLL